MKRIYETCPICNGKGVVTTTDWSSPERTNGERTQWTTTCGNCKGTGKVATIYWLDQGGE